jgi:hypothetical protein
MNNDNKPLKILMKMVIERKLSIRDMNVCGGE